MAFAAACQLTVVHCPLPIGFRQLRITHYALRIGKHRDPASSPPRFSRVFFPFFRGGGLQSGFPVAYYAARPFPGRVVSLATEQRNATCGNRASARSHNIPAGFPAGSFEESEPESSGQIFRNGEFDPGSE